MAMVKLVLEEDDDLADAELWAAIDSAAALSTRLPHNLQSRPLLLTHFSQDRKPPLLSEIPPSPQPASSAFRSEQRDLPRTPKNQQLRSHSVYTFESRQAFSEPKRRATKPSSTRISDQHKENRSWIDVDDDVRMKNHEMYQNRVHKSSSEKFPLKDVAPANDSMLIPHEFRDRCLMGSPLGGGNEKECVGASAWMAGLPSTSLFKQIQEAAMGVLEKSDYIAMQGKPYIKKSGWRKIAFFFNISFEIKDKQIQFDQSANVVRAEFIVRASMQGGRFSDGWGSCDSREKRFSKPNHDIPSTAETRAKTRSCQDLLGIGEYKVGCGDHGW